MACLVITVQAAGVAYHAARRRPGHRLDRHAAQAARRRRDDLLRRQHAGDRDGDRAVDRQSVLKVWNENFLWSAPSYFVGAGAAAVAAWMVTGLSAHWIAPLALAPLYLTYRTYKVYLGRIEDEQRHVREMADLHLATIEALALAIDAKDQTSQSHIRRVQLYAASVARALGMSDNEVQGVKTAALLHDIGKLAVPEHILSKPGPLTPEEFQKIRAHPKVGADIVSSVPFPYPVAPLILSHHERWDGKGYPTGLKGEEIPLGARILSVVDYFDALMAERPYHKAMSFDAAIGAAAAGGRQGPRSRRWSRSSSSCCRRCRPRRRSLEHCDAQASGRSAAASARPAGDRPLARAREEERVRGHRARAPRNLRALRDRPGDGHEPRRVRHDGAHRGQAEQPRAVLVRRAVPLRRGHRDAALPVRHRRRCRDHPAGRRPQRRGPDRLGRAQPPAAGQRAAERRSRGRRARRATTTLQSALVCPLLFNDSSSARCRSITSSRRSTATITAGCSTACRSRPAPSSRTRCCSSRRRRTR